MSPAAVLMALCGLFQTQDSDLEKDIHALCQQLRSEDVSLRDAASRKLRRIGARVIPALEKIESDPDPEVSVRAASLLHYLRKKQQLERGLPADIKAYVFDVVERLSTRGYPEWTKVFLEADTSKKASYPPRISRRSLDVLSERAVLGIRTSKEARRVLDIIEQSDCRSAIPALVATLTRPDMKIRQYATDALIRLRALEAEAALMDLLTHQEPLGRPEAIKVLASIKSAKLSTLIPKLLVDPDEAVRASTVSALFALLGEEAIPRIATMLSDPGPVVRKAAVWELTRLDARKELPALRRLLNDRDQGVLAVTLEAFYLLCQKDERPTLEELMNHPNPELRLLVVRNPLSYPSSPNTELLKAATKDEDPRVRAAAKEALGRIRKK